MNEETYQPYGIADRLKLAKKLYNMNFMEWNKVEGQKEIIACMSNDHVMMVIAKTKKSQEVLKILDSAHDKEKPLKIPKLNFKAKKDELIVSSYSSEYSSRIISFFKYLDGGYSLATGKAFPCAYYNDDWEFILAPRLDDDNVNNPFCQFEEKKKGKKK